MRTTATKPPITTNAATRADARSDDTCPGGGPAGRGASVGCDMTGLYRASCDDQLENASGALERETGFEPATFCLGSPELVSVVARAWMSERILDSHGVADTPRTMPRRARGPRVAQAFASEIDADACSTECLHPEAIAPLWVGHSGAMGPFGRRPLRDARRSLASEDRALPRDHRAGPLRLRHRPRARNERVGTVAPTPVPPAACAVEKRRSPCAT
jgi:hypothetical protein